MLFRSLNDEKKIKDADVYHVDENDNVENMDGSVAKNGDVEFETTHFSTYVIVGNKRDDKIKVTIEHYDATTGEKIYADDVDKELSVGQKFDCKKATNWDIKEVKVVIDGKENTVAAGVCYGSSIENCSVVNSSLESKRNNNNNCAGSIVGYSTGGDRKSTRLNSSHMPKSRMPSSA